MTRADGETDAQDLFDYSMELNDARFDESYKYIAYVRIIIYWFSSANISLD